MKEYPRENWRILGRYVQRLRLPVKADMHEWAGKVGRSTRMLEGLERGEHVGPKTVILVAGALGVDPEDLFNILETGRTPADQSAPALRPAPLRSIEDPRYTGQVQLVREHVATWYLNVPAENRDHAVNLLVQFTDEHPVAGDEGD